MILCKYAIDNGAEKEIRELSKELKLTVHETCQEVFISPDMAINDFVSNHIFSFRLDI